MSRGVQRQTAIEHLRDHFDRGLTLTAPLRKHPPDREGDRCPSLATRIATIRSALPRCSDVAGSAR